MNKSQKIKSLLAIALCLVLAAVCVVLTGKVGINYSISDYLGEETDTKQALVIMNEEFGVTTDIKVMVENIDTPSASALAVELQAVDGVLSVGFDATDPHYYKDETALFSLMVDGDEYSASAAQTLDGVKAVMDKQTDRKVTYGGTCVQSGETRSVITREMPRILAISLGLVVVVLLLVSASWLEPFVLLACAGVAVVINLGTNILFGEISYITNSVAAILQLALSIDYSIMLLHGYRREREKTTNSIEAAKATVKTVVRPVSASALTTLAGLLALLFMSFGIGFDIGMVLMKGIVISAVISLTLFPLLIVWTEKWMQKTPKKAFIPRGSRFSAFAAKAGRVVVPVFLVLVVVCGVVSGNTAYTFAVGGDVADPIEETFGNNSRIVLVYKNTDNILEAERAFVQRIGAMQTDRHTPILVSYTARSNTVEQVYDAKALSAMMAVSPSDAEMLTALCGLYEMPDSVTMTAKEFVTTVSRLLENDRDVAALPDNDTKETVKTLLAAEHPLLLSDTAYTFEEMATGIRVLFSSDGVVIDEHWIAAVYMKYALANGVAQTEASARSLVEFVCAQTENPLIASRLTAEQKETLAKTQAMLREASSQLCSERYSRMVLTVDLPAEGEETDRFMKEVSAAVDELFGEEAYPAGTIPSTYDLKQTFDHDNVLISIFTVVSVFVIVMVLFRSLSLPLLLVTVIQGAIWCMMAALLAMGQGVFFMSYIMAICILMGATIDYGILMSSNYVELRRTKEKGEALKDAVDAAMPTVFTSGTILAVCGIVIYFISGQAAISIVGLLVGVGAVASTLFITAILPSLLWVLDGFVMKLTLKRRR